MLVLAMIGCAGQNKDSQPEADKAAARDPFDTTKEPAINPNTHFAAGQVAESQGNAAGALEQYKLALKQDPNHQQTLYRMGIVYTRLKSYPEAIDTWQKYVDATGKSADAYSNLGLTYILNNEPGNAEAAFKSGIAADPHNERCRMNYGLM